MFVLSATSGSARARLRWVYCGGVNQAMEWHNMYGTQITELGQIDQQENMRLRAQAQAERRARRSAHRERISFVRGFLAERDAASRRVVGCHYGTSGND
jgi:hypothetical protein